MTLEEAVLDWIKPYWNARHLVRTRGWALELEAEAPEVLLIAALTHDMERHFPGGPKLDPRTMAPDDESYYRRHSERSAAIVSRWLRSQGADEGLIKDVHDLVRLHETGGTPMADVLQAADSVSFLEVNADLMLRWTREGFVTADWARAKHRWMFERIALLRARERAEEYYQHALAALESETGTTAGELADVAQ